MSIRKKKIQSICVFGDSTAWGAWDMEKGGWVNRLWLQFAKRTDGECEIYNLSISGGTTQTILKRFESEAKIREADGLIFQSGGNDSCFVGKRGRQKIPLKRFRDNLEKIIKRAKKITPDILFIGLKNVDESRTKPVSWVDVYYTNEEIQKCNNVMQEVCKERHVLFLDLFGQLHSDDLDDGLHPNAGGHEKVFIAVRKCLQKNKWL